MKETSTVTQKVFDAIMKIRDKGEVNLFDRRAVEQRLNSNGSYEAGMWVHDNEEAYANVVFGEFEIVG